MSLSSAICKLFRFLANMFGVVVEAVANAVKVVGAAAVDILSELAENIGDALGINGSTVLWLLGGGVLLYFLMSGDDRSSVSRTPQTIEV